VRIDADGTRNTFGLLQGFVRNQGDGWTYTLDFLARAVEEMAVTGTEAAGDAAEMFAPYLAFASILGRRLAELHAVLAEPTDDPSFAPETVDAAAADAWADGAIEQIDAALKLLAPLRDDADGDPVAEDTVNVLDHADALRAAVRRLARTGIGALQTRVHGDFHLGQVLVTQGDATIIDFEGEPARPMEQRRAKSSPIRDVSGLLRSFDYAAATAAPGRTAASAGTEERRMSLLVRFRDAASAAFLSGYREVLASAPNPWVKPIAERALLDLFLIEKAAYEIRYEAANRPGWIGIPLRGMAGLLDRVTTEPAA
jgi:maltose alpha-D-glucosyltransferase/alpha-amylase